MLNRILLLNFPQPNIPTVFPGRRAPQGEICNGLAFQAIVNDGQDTRSVRHDLGRKNIQRTVRTAPLR